MAPGAWVFPITIAGFLVFLTAWLVANPATPAPSRETLPRVGPLDAATVELSVYVGDDAPQIFLSTIEAMDPTVGNAPVPPGATYTRDPLVLAPSHQPWHGHVVNMTVNETVRVPIGSGMFGTFSGTHTLPLALAQFNRTVTLAHGDPLPNGAFDYDAFVRTHSQALGRPVAPGDEVNCEPERRWGLCLVLDLDDANQAVMYERLIDDGVRIPLFGRAYLRPAETLPADLIAFPAFELEFRIVDEERFEIRLRLEPGQSFNLDFPLATWPPGAYRVQDVEGDEATVRFAPFGPRGAPPAALIGQAVWFEYTVIGVTPAQAPP